MTDDRRQHAAENAKNAAGKASRLGLCGSRVGIDAGMWGNTDDRVHEDGKSDKTDAEAKVVCRRVVKDAGITWAEANDHKMGKTVINGMRWVWMFAVNDVI